MPQKNTSLILLTSNFPDSTYGNQKPETDAHLGSDVVRTPDQDVRMGKGVPPANTTNQSAGDRPSLSLEHPGRPAGFYLQCDQSHGEPSYQNLFRDISN